jgi:cell division septation protein DedD
MNNRYGRLRCFNNSNPQRHRIGKRITTGLIILSLCALVFSISIQGASAAASASIQSASLDKSTYVPGETVKVKVTIKNGGAIDLSNLKINVDIADPNGNNVIASTLKSGISVSKGKTFSTNYINYYTLPKDSVAGTYKITIGLWNSDSSTQYDIKYRTASFNVKIPPTPTTPKPTTPKPTTPKPTTPKPTTQKPTTPKPTTPTPTPPKILASVQSASADKSTYVPGETVKVKVTIKNGGTVDLSNLKINVDITDPNGNNVIASTLKSGISVSKGKTYSADYTGYYTIPKDPVAGTYKITVGLWNSDSSTQYDIKYRTASFNVKIPPTPTTPKPTTPKSTTLKPTTPKPTTPKPTTPIPTTPTPPPPKQQSTSAEKSTYNSGDVIVQEFSLDKSSYKPGEIAKAKFSIKNKGNYDLFNLKINVDICETSPCKDTTLKSIGLKAGEVYSSDYIDFYRIPDNPTLKTYGATIHVLSSDNRYYDGKYKSFTIETKEKGSASGLFDKNEKQRFEIKPEEKEYSSNDYYDYLMQRDGNKITIKIKGLNDKLVLKEVTKYGTIYYGYLVPLKVPYIKKGDEVRIEISPPSPPYLSKDIGYLAVELKRADNSNIDIDAVIDDYSTKDKNRIHVDNTIYDSINKQLTVDLKFNSLGEKCSFWVICEPIKTEDFPIVIVVAESNVAGLIKDLKPFEILDGLELIAIFL